MSRSSQGSRSVAAAASPAETRLDITSLDGIARKLIGDSLVQSSRKDSAQATYNRFCRNIGEKSLPASEDLLILFVAHELQKVVPATSQSYLSAVRHLHIVQGLGGPPSRSAEAGAGTERCTKIMTIVEGPTPSNHTVLRRLKGVWLSGTPSFNNQMMWAACLLCFFRFLRSGEVTVPTTSSFSNSWHMTPLDIVVDSLVDPTAMQITLDLKASKTDQARVGTTVIIERTRDDLCPVAAVFQYLALRGVDNGPLFNLEAGQPLTQQIFVELLKVVLVAASIDPSHFSGHCFRIGASTTVTHGLSDVTIQRMGRWKSDSYHRYVRPSNKELAQVAGKLSNSVL